MASAGEGREDDVLVKISTSRPFVWWIRHVATRIDPLLFKATNGRWTSFGAPSMPMVTLTMVGRKTGRARSVHLAAYEHDGDLLVVASAMGKASPPAWQRNLEANPIVRVQAAGERYTAVAEPIPDTQKDRLWADLRVAIPQMRVYETRTTRNIRIFRLRRTQDP